jgi:heptosyltransferase-2
MCPSRILILRGGAVGDFIVTLPALAAIRAHWLDAQITLATYPRTGRLAQVGGLAQRLLSLDDAAAARLFGDAPDAVAASALALWLGATDLAVSYLHDPDGRVAARLREAGVAHVLALRPPRAEGAGHAADVLAVPLAAMGIRVPRPCQPVLDLPADLRVAGKALLPETTTPCVSIHPGSGSAIKNWPLGRYLDVAAALQADRLQPVVVIGEVEEALLPELRQAAPDLPLIQCPDLAVVAGALAACVLHVGNDSGLAHLAAAVGTPVVAVFGPSDPARWAPRGPAVRIVRAAGGGLADMPVATVLAACRELLARPGLSWRANPG